MLKYFIFLLSFLFTAISLSSQPVRVPNKIDFQAIARNQEGEPMVEQRITVRFTILVAPLPGMMVYQEEHQTHTDKYGQFVLPIGTGSESSGSFDTIDWSAGPHFVRVEVDPTGGSTFIEMGTMEMMTVPYAFYARHAENVEDADADPLNELQQLQLEGEVLSLSKGGRVQLPDASAENELQTLALGENNVLSLSRGNSVQLPAGAGRWKENNQSIYLESGRVGIGLSSVPHTLTLFGENQAYMSYLTSGQDIGQEDGFLVGLNRTGNSALIWNYEQGDLRFGTNDETRMYINQFGRIGIGTTAPGEKLEIRSPDDNVGLRINAGERKTARLSMYQTAGKERFGYSWEYDGDQGILSLRANGYRDDAEDKFISITRDGVSDIGIRGVLNLESIEHESSLLQLTNVNDPGTRLTLGLNRGEPVLDFAGQPLTIHANGRTAMSILTNGHVGIGIDDPSLDLEVVGNAEISKNFGVKEDLMVQENADLLGTLTVGEGATFDQIEEFNGTTGDGIGNHSVDFAYPDGYNHMNTRILSLQIQVESGWWLGTGGGYASYNGLTSVSRDNSVRKITATLLESAIRIYYPARETYQNQPFRLLLLRMSAKI